MNDGTTRARTAACFVLLAAALGGDASAQDGKDPDSDKPREAKQCLDHPKIRSTQILNDRNIVFVLKDDAIYNSQLPRQCPSLRRNSLVNYAIANREVCAGGQFQVLMQTGLGNYTPTFTCFLGVFVPIDESELEHLAASTDEDRERRRTRRRSTREAVTTEQVELPPPAEPTPPPATPAE